MPTAQFLAKAREALMPQHSMRSNMPRRKMEDVARLRGRAMPQENYMIDARTATEYYISFSHSDVASAQIAVSHKRRAGSFYEADDAAAVTPVKWMSDITMTCADKNGLWRRRMASRSLTCR